jgi:hypothetical protein
VFFRYLGGLTDAWLAVARFGRMAWRALPGDLMGLLVMRACGIPGITREVEVDGLSAVLVEHPSAGRYLDRGFLPIRAQTLGRYIFARERLSAALVEHELEHVRQWQRFGPLFLPAYFASSAAAWMGSRNPYLANRFEVAARRREWAASETPPQTKT